MAKYIDAERLKAEIERRKLQNRHIDTDGYEAELFEIIDSLQQEQPSEICSKCIHHGKDDGYCYNPYGGMQSLVNENGVYECTGFCEQEQQEEPDKSLEESAKEYAEGPECTWVGTTALEEAFKAGAKWQKQQMLKDAVEAKIYGYDDGSFELIASWLDMPNNSIYKDGDKVRIIIVKEEEK